MASSSTSSNDLWRVRGEDATGQGRAIRFERLSQGISNGLWREVDQVLAPGEQQWRLIGEHPQMAEYVPHRTLFRARGAEEAEVDLTPMIDVTFQLLIFFMIAATYIVQKTLDMPRPEPSEEGTTVTMQELEKNNIIVTVGSDRSITVQGAAASLDNLPDLLKSAARQMGSAELVLDVHDDVDHQTVVRVIDAAGAAQIEKVNFVARASPAEGS